MHQNQLGQLQNNLAGKDSDLLRNATAATSAVSGALQILESLYPNVRVADNPAVIQLFSSDRTKLLALLHEEAIYAWARNMTGSKDLVRITRSHWGKLQFSFAPKTSDPRSINQTFLRTKSPAFQISAFYDLCLNSVQLLRAFPSLQLQTSKCDVS
jgi:hypothetical protein